MQLVLQVVVRVEGEVVLGPHLVGVEGPQGRRLTTPALRGREARTRGGQHCTTTTWLHNKPRLAEQPREGAGAGYHGSWTHLAHDVGYDITGLDVQAAAQHAQGNLGQEGRGSWHYIITEQYSTYLVQ